MSFCVFFNFTRKTNMFLTFFYSVKRHKTFSTRWHHHPQHPCQFTYFFDARWIFYDFSCWKPPKHCPDVTQREFIVGFRSSLACGTRAGPHTRLQKLGAFRETAQVLGVEGGGFGVERCVRHIIFFCTLQTCPNFCIALYLHENHACQFSVHFGTVCIFYGFWRRQSENTVINQNYFILTFSKKLRIPSSNFVFSFSFLPLFIFSFI